MSEFTFFRRRERNLFFCILKAFLASSFANCGGLVSTGDGDVDGVPVFDADDTDVFGFVGDPAFEGGGGFAGAGVQISMPTRTAWSQEVRVLTRTEALQSMGGN